MCWGDICFLRVECIWRWGSLCFSHPLVLYPSLTNAAETWYYYSHPLSGFLQSKQSFSQAKMVWPGRDFILFLISQTIYQYSNFIGVSDKKFKRRAWGLVCKLFEWPCLVEIRSTVLNYQQKDVLLRAFFLESLLPHSDSPSLQFPNYQKLVHFVSLFYLRFLLSVSKFSLLISWECPESFM